MADRYTKCVLTVIAVGLAIIAYEQRGALAPDAKAQYSGPVHVIVDQWGAYVATLPLSVTMH